MRYTFLRCSRVVERELLSLPDTFAYIPGSKTGDPSPLTSLEETCLYPQVLSYIFSSSSIKTQFPSFRAAHLNLAYPFLIKSPWWVLEQGDLMQNTSLGSIFAVSDNKLSLTQRVSRDRDRDGGGGGDGNSMPFLHLQNYGRLAY